MLTQERLKELLSYDPESGEFRWLVTINNRAQKGSIAGCIDLHSGYRRTSISKSIYRCHRLAWLYMYGVWPQGDIDHIDGNRSNNCLVNLREATPSQNKFNTDKNCNNTTGFKGVNYRRSDGKFTAYTESFGKAIYLGSYITAELASAAYNEFAKTHHGEFYRPIKEK